MIISLAFKKSGPDEPKTILTTAAFPLDFSSSLNVLAPMDLPYFQGKSIALMPPDPDITPPGPTEIIVGGSYQSTVPSPGTGDYRHWQLRRYAIDEGSTPFSLQPVPFESGSPNDELSMFARDLGDIRWLAGDSSIEKVRVDTIGREIYAVGYLGRGDPGYHSPAVLALFNDDGTLVNGFYGNHSSAAYDDPGYGGPSLPYDGIVIFDEPAFAPTNGGEFLFNVTNSTFRDIALRRHGPGLPVAEVTLMWNAFCGICMPADGGGPARDITANGILQVIR